MESALSEYFDRFTEEVREKVLNSQYTESYLKAAPTEKEATETRICMEQIFMDFDGLDGVRLIGADGRRIHFSTFDTTDLLRSSGIIREYINYTDLVRNSDEPDTELIRPQEEAGIFFDRRRVIVTMPFFSGHQFSGFFAFYFSQDGISRHLAVAGITYPEERILPVSDGRGYGGFVTGIPGRSEDDFEKAVISAWKNGHTSEAVQITAESGGSPWILITSAAKIMAGEVIDGSALFIPGQSIVILQICFSVTVFLMFFFLLNIRGDSGAELSYRIRRIQAEMIQEFLDGNGDSGWAGLAETIRGREEELSAEIKKALGRKADKNDAAVNLILERNWNEILNALEEKSGIRQQRQEEDLDQIRKLLEELLRRTEQQPVSRERAVPVKIPDGQFEEIDSIDDIEEIPELEQCPEPQNPADAAEPEELVPDGTQTAAGADGQTEFAVDISEFSDGDSLNKNYEENNETYFQTREIVFPDVDNVFAEELCLGDEYVRLPETDTDSAPFDVVCPPFIASCG